MRTKSYLKSVLSSVLLFFMVTCPGILLGTNYYWVGNTSAWDALNGWATGSGGTGSITWNNATSAGNVAYFTSDAAMAIFTSTTNIKVGGLNSSANVSIGGASTGLGKFVFTTGGTSPATATVNSGKYLDLGNIQFSTSANSGAGSGLIKSGAGELALLGSNSSTTYVFGCTLSDGILTMRGSYALGSAGLTINGGTLIMGADNLAPSLTSISLAGNFTLGGQSSISSLGTTTGNSITFPSVTTTLTTNRTITIGGSGTYTFAGQVTGASSLTIAGSGGGKIVLSNTTNNYSGGTIINGGKLELGASGVLLDAGTITLGGGTLSTGATAGYSETVGTLALTDNSTIALGTGSHTITFADSHLTGWTAGKTLTITGWSGTVGTGGGGTSGKIMVGTGGLSVQQLSQIAWGGGYSGAVITGSGELVPANAPIVTPTLTAAGSASVDAAFNVTFTDDSNWRAAITGVTVNGTALTAGYSVSAGQITFTPSTAVPAGLLQASGVKSIAVSASGGYADATVSQTISVGAENKVVIATQPKKATVSGGTLSTQPIVNITDQYGNIVTTSTTSVTASVATGTWTLGGTTSVAAVSGVVTFTNLTATYDPSGVIGASISFGNGGSLTSATSSTFNLPAVEPTATVTGLNYTSIGSNTMTINWTPAVSGGGSNHIVLVRAISDVTTGPSDNVSYTANTAYGSGSAVGSGYVVYSGTGNSVTVTGLSALTTYFVRVYEFNGSGGVENYLTTGYASGSQISLRRTLTSIVASGDWGTAGTWDGNAVPTTADNVVVASGHAITYSNSTNYCYNLTVSSTGKLSCNGGGIGYIGIYGTSMQIDGTFGDAVTETFSGLQFNQNCTLTGGGTIRINRIRPMTTAANATFTLDADATLTNSSGVTLMAESQTAGSNNIGYTINTGRTVTSLGSLTGGSTSSTNAAYGCSFTVNGTLNVNSSIYMNAATGQNAILTVNGTLNVKTFNGSGSAGGAIPTFVVNGSGLIKVTGSGATADFTNPSTAGNVTGTGTFTLDAGATYIAGGADGINPTTGRIRCSTRNFSTAANYTFTGSSAQVTGSDLPATVNTLTNTNTAGLTVSNNLTANTLTNAATYILNIDANKHLTVNTTLTNNGTINLKSTASGTATLIPPATITGTGTFNVEQYLATTRNWYVSSPVSNGVAPSGYTYYQRDEVGSSWTSQPFVAGNTFVAGKGYIALPGSTASALQFSGTLNNGNINVTLTKSGSGFNLIGNPYSSHLTWTKTFVDNNAALIQPTIWYRTNTGSVNSGGDAAWSFKTINASTGEASPLGTSNVIPPMQAFWVKALAAGTLTLNTDLTKSHQASNPLKAPAMNSTDRQRVRLEVSNGTSTDETLLYFDTNASNNLDSYDSPKFMDSNSIMQIYSTIDSEKLVINGMNTLPLDQEIKLGFIPGTANSFSLKANELTNLPADVKVILRDNATTIETDLSDGVSTYTFSPATYSGDRFSILFRSPGVTTATINPEKEKISVFVNAQNEIVINANAGSKYAIYNAVGQQIANGALNYKLQTINCKLKTGVYVVKVGNSSTRVIIK